MVWRSEERADRATCAYRIILTRSSLTGSQSVGYSNAIQAILLATYRALEQLPPGYLPSDLLLPSLPAMSNTRASQSRITSHLGGLVTAPASRQGSRAGSPSPALPLPPIPSHHGLFQYVWCGLAGISTPEDVDAFQSLVVDGLGTSPERVKITNGEAISF